MSNTNRIAILNSIHAAMRRHSEALEVAGYDTVTYGTALHAHTEAEIYEQITGQPSNFEQYTVANEARVPSSYSNRLLIEACQLPPRKAELADKLCKYANRAITGV